MNRKILPFILFLSACSGNLDFREDFNQDPGQDTPGQQQQQSSGSDDSSPSSSGIETDDESTSDDYIANTQFDSEISIIYNGNSATVSGEVAGVSISRDGAHITVTNEGDSKVRYTLSGSSDDGCFKLYSSKKQAIILKDLSLTNPDGAAINNQSGKRTFVVLEGSNTLADGNVNSDGSYPEETSEEDMKAAFFSEGQLIVSGTGALTVNANGKAGITSDDYIRFMESIKVNVNSSKGHGVRGKDAVIVSGGDISIALASTATGKKCLTTDSLIFINGGNTTLVNKASAGTVDSELTGAAGIKADKEFVIRDGVLTITASGKGGKCISSDGDGFFEGGTVIAKSTGANYGNSGRYSDSDNSISSKAIKFDGHLVFSGAAVTAVCSSHEAIESKKTISISSGKVSAASSSDDAVNSSSTMTISDGIVYACSSGNDGLDANGNLYIKGGAVYAIGCGSPEVAIDANTESGYKLYIEGGSVIAIGGIESGSSVSQAVISTSWSKNTFYSLCSGSSVIYSFKTPSSGGSGLFLTAPSLANGTSYTLTTAATVNDVQSSIDNVLSLGGTASGGNSSSVSASTYSSNGGTIGGGQGGGQGGRPWGW